MEKDKLHLVRTGIHADLFQR
nr:hypothetical protein [Bartonella sp. DB5-6]